MRTGGFGGFFASVRDIGATGQQQQASKVSADEAVRGGAGGFFISRGGGTKPGSLLPSFPDRTVPVQSVKDKATDNALWLKLFFMGLRIGGFQ